MRRRILENAIGAGQSVIHIDQTNPDPFTRVSGDINGLAVQWIRQNSHRVLAKKTSEGEVAYCRLDDADSNKYYDGTLSNLTGSEGDVFVKLPKFFYYGTEGDQVDLVFSLERIDDEQIEWDENTLIGAYEAHSGPGGLFSLSNFISAGSMSHQDMKDLAVRRGAGYQLVDWQMHCVLGCLYYAMYGNTDCQATIGYGTGSYEKPAGQTDYLGMQDTQASTNGNTHSINFWGLENWWGNKWEWIDDYDNPAKTLTATVNDPVTGGTRNLPFRNFKGYCPKKMKFGKYLDLVNTEPDSETGSTSTYYCDYQWWSGSTSASSRVVARSYSDSNAGCGVASETSFYGSSNSGPTFGSRLAFRGECNEIQDVQIFKSIAIS